MMILDVAFIGVTVKIRAGFICLDLDLVKLGELAVTNVAQPTRGSITAENKYKNEKKRPPKPSPNGNPTWSPRGKDFESRFY